MSSLAERKEDSCPTQVLSSSNVLRKNRFRSLTPEENEHEASEKSDAPVCGDGSSRFAESVDDTELNADSYELSSISHAQDQQTLGDTAITIPS